VPDALGYALPRSGGRTRRIGRRSGHRGRPPQPVGNSSQPPLRLLPSPCRHGRFYRGATGASSCR
jgi:hypothetical protein